MKQQGTPCPAFRTLQATYWYKYYHSMPMCGAVPWCQIAQMFLSILPWEPLGQNHYCYPKPTSYHVFHIEFSTNLRVRYLDRISALEMICLERIWSRTKTRSESKQCVSHSFLTSSWTAQPYVSNTWSGLKVYQFGVKNWFVCMYHLSLSDWHCFEAPFEAPLDAQTTIYMHTSLTGTSVCLWSLTDLFLASKSWW